jgi:hypothetical protein
MSQHVVLQRFTYSVHIFHKKYINCLYTTLRSCVVYRLNLYTFLYNLWIKMLSEVLFKLSVLKNVKCAKDTLHLCT